MVDEYRYQEGWIKLCWLFELLAPPCGKMWTHNWTRIPKMGSLCLHKFFWLFIVYLIHLAVPACFWTLGKHAHSKLHTEIHAEEPIWESHRRTCKQHPQSLTWESNPGLLAWRSQWWTLSQVIYQDGKLFEYQNKRPVEMFL